MGEGEGCMGVINICPLSIFVTRQGVCPAMGVGMLGMGRRGFTMGLIFGLGGAGWGWGII